MVKKAKTKHAKSPVASASCPVRELTSPRDVQSASWQSTSWHIRELSSNRSYHLFLVFLSTPYLELYLIMTDAIKKCKYCTPVNITGMAHVNKESHILPATRVQSDTQVAGV